MNKLLINNVIRQILSTKNPAQTVARIRKDLIAKGLIDENLSMTNVKDLNVVADD